MLCSDFSNSTGHWLKERHKLWKEKRKNLLVLGPLETLSIKGRLRLPLQPKKKFSQSPQVRASPQVWKGEGTRLIYYLLIPQRNEENYLPLPRYTPRIVLEMWNPSPSEPELRLFSVSPLFDSPAHSTQSHTHTHTPFKSQLHNYGSGTIVCHVPWLVCLGFMIFNRLRVSNTTLDSHQISVSIGDSNWINLKR